MTSPALALPAFVLAVTLLFSSHALAQQPGKVYRIARLGVNAPAPANTNTRQCPRTPTGTWQVWVEGMRAQGFVEDETVVTHCRYTEGYPDRAPGNAADLLRLSPDLFLANGTANTRAAQAITRTLPILMHGVVNPVGRGLVASLALPGGNTTGITDEGGPEIAGKLLQLLNEAVPRATRVAVLMGSAPGPLEPNMGYGPVLEATAQTLGVTLQRYRAAAPAEFVGAFAAMTAARAQALFIMPHPLFGGTANLRTLAQLARDHRLPAIVDVGEFVRLGGLLSYGRNEFEEYRRLPIYAAKLLNGAPPGTMPVEQPTQYELHINVKTATALGLTLPGTLLIQAHEVIR